MMVKTSYIGSAAIVGIIVAITCTTRAAPFVDQRSLDILFRPDNNTIRAFQNFLRAPIFGIFNGGGPLVKVTRLNDLHTAIANNNASASDLPNRPGLISSLGLGSLLGGFGGGLGGGLGGLFGGGSAPATTTARPATTTTVRTTTTTKSSAAGIGGSLQVSGRIGGEGGALGSINLGGGLNVGGILSQLGTSLAGRITTTTAPDTDVSIRGSFSSGTEDDSNENIAVISLGTSEEDKSSEKAEGSSSSISASVSASASTSTSTTTTTTTTTSSPFDDDDDEDDDSTSGVTVSISVAAGPEESASAESIIPRLGEESDDDKKVGVSGEVSIDTSLLNSVFGQIGATTAASVSSSGYQYSSPTEAKPGYQYEKQGNSNFDIGVGFTANSKSSSNGQVNAEVGSGNSIANLEVNLSGRSSTDDDDGTEDADNEVDNKPSDNGNDDDDDDKDANTSNSDDRGNRNDGGRRNARTNQNSLLSLRVNPRDINNLRYRRDTSGVRSLVS